MMTKDLIEDLFEGEIIDPHKFLGVVQKHIKEISAEGKGIVFSGQPRSILEAFGDSSLKGFMDFIVELYGKENILLFNLINGCSQGYSNKSSALARSSLAFF